MEIAGNAGLERLRAQSTGHRWRRFVIGTGISEARIANPRFQTLCVSFKLID